MNTKQNKDADKQADDRVDANGKTCGIIMPIAALGNYPESHWKDVRLIIDAAIQKAGFTPNMVSESNHIGVILKRIVQNIYDNPIVVCDVSGKNPNVMFELGMRLAFDKPVVIIKDEQTDYSFDTSVIEHVPYRRDLRIHETQAFIELLAEKISATYEESQSNKKFSAFLKHFGTFEVAGLEHKTGSADEVLLATMKDMQTTLAMLLNREKFNRIRSSRSDDFLSWARMPLELESMSSSEEVNAVRNIIRAIILRSDDTSDPQKVYVNARTMVSEMRPDIPPQLIRQIVDDELKRSTRKKVRMD
ncbi:hypothetical protein [Brucella intermedia]|uniref:hypothetical protein n=1 Tax=Brucella intermedia TaxID=94625 RepID=UPI00244B1F6D|nr:hypothetical protein [Brucella intermedia]WGG60289.1 hypothetical protein QA414_05050 [Brucella intermedia]